MGVLGAYVGSLRNRKGKVRPLIFTLEAEREQTLSGEAKSGKVPENYHLGFTQQREWVER